MLAIILTSPFSWLILGFAGLSSMVSAWKVGQIKKSLRPAEVDLKLIWMVGLVAMLVGLMFFFLFAFVNFADDVYRAGDIAPELLSENFKHGGTYAVLGFAVLIFSVVKFAVAREYRAKVAAKVAIDNKYTDHFVDSKTG